MTQNVISHQLDSQQGFRTGYFKKPAWPAAHHGRGFDSVLCSAQAGGFPAVQDLPFPRFHPSHHLRHSHPQHRWRGGHVPTRPALFHDPDENGHRSHGFQLFAGRVGVGWRPSAGFHRGLFVRDGLDHDVAVQKARHVSSALGACLSGDVGMRGFSHHRHSSGGKSQERGHGARGVQGC